MAGPLAAWIEHRSGSFNAALEPAGATLILGLAFLALAWQRQRSAIGLRQLCR